DGAVVVHLLLDGSDDVRAPLRRRVLVRPDADGPFADLLALLPDLEREVVTVHAHRAVVGGRLDGVLAGVHPAARTVRTRRQQDVRPVPALLDHGNPGRGADLLARQLGERVAARLVVHGDRLLGVQNGAGSVLARRRVVRRRVG